MSASPLPEPLRNLTGRAVGELYDKAAIVLIREGVLEELLAFSERNLRRERGGFLIGGIVDNDGPVLEIRHFLPATQTREEVASLTFTHDTWAALNRSLDEEKYHGEKVLGWHHTHPGLGIFLSAHDLFIHRHFFAQAWQIALVVDPVRHELGFFHWRDGDVLGCGFVVVEGS